MHLNLVPFKLQKYYTFESKAPDIGPHDGALWDIVTRIQKFMYSAFIK